VQIIWTSNIDTDIIHGDIKPHNVLVFKHATGKTAVQVTDFGYSTFAASEAFVPGGAGRVFLPKSRPWNAPEHHFGEFTVTEAKKTDVYSFGMLCLWILLGSTHISQMTQIVSFESSSGPLTPLEQLKADDKLERMAYKHMESLPDFNIEHRKQLQEFFSMALQCNPEKRVSNLGKLLHLLRMER